MKKIIKIEENEVVTIEGNQIVITKENTTTENSDVNKKVIGKKLRLWLLIVFQKFEIENTGHWYNSNVVLAIFNC